MPVARIGLVLFSMSVSARVLLVSRHVALPPPGLRRRPAVESSACRPAQEEKEPVGTVWDHAVIETEFFCLVCCRPEP